jgi:Uncharacterized protein conserved in bacteria
MGRKNYKVGHGNSESGNSKVAKVSKVSKVSKPTSRKGLPEKICVACERPFTWRKKWARDWDNVKYCSERCRRSSK